MCFCLVRSCTVRSDCVLRRFQENLQSTGLVPSGARVLLGYSGGADSTCLLHLLSLSGIDTVAAHLHHGQREEADEELEHCSQVCESLDVPFVSGKADVPRMSNDLKIGLEEAGRLARYNFFETAKRQTSSWLIATAHTSDDHLETVLFHIARGSGLPGLVGIRAERSGIIRPLLPFSRAETRDYCLQHGLWFHDDPANDDHDLSRARIRHRVVPELEQINPDIRTSAQRLSNLVAEDEALLNGLSASLLEQNEIVLNSHLAFLTADCELAVTKSAFVNNPKPLTSRALRLAVGALGGSLDYGATTGVLSSFESRKGSWTADGGEVCIEWDETAVHFRKLVPTHPFRYNLTVPGATDSLEFGWTIEALPVAGGSFVRDKNCLEVVLDPSSLKGNLYFRTAEEGEIVSPLGLSGSKKLSDLFQERRLTSAARRRLPVVCDFIGPVWIPGVCLTERVKMTEYSTGGLQLRLQPLTVPPGGPGLERRP